MTANSNGRPRYLRSGEVAAIFNVSTATINRYAKAGKLPFMWTMGGAHKAHRRFPEDKILQLAKELEEEV